MTMTQAVHDGGDRRGRDDDRRRGARAELSDAADHRDHPVRRRQRQRRGQPHHARQDVASRWASRSWSRTSPAPAATPAPQLAAKAAPDGYTLVGAGSGPIAANLDALQEPRLRPARRTWTIISPFASFTIVVTASNKLGIKSLKELIERAKKEPGALNYGSVGIGCSQHLAGEYFAQVTGVKLTHVPYRNIAQYGPDLIAGRCQLGFQWYPNVAGPINANGATALAVAGDERLARAARHADHDGGRPAAIQGRRLVRAGRAGRHAAADHRAAQQGAERGAQRPGGEGRASRRPAPCRSALALDAGEEIPRR